MAGRKWTADELTVLRAGYRRGRCAGLARKYDRRPAWTPELEARYRALHAQGRTDAEIAREWGKESVLRVWLNAHRRRLGLPSNRSKNPHFSALMREKLRLQLAAAGKRTFADYRHDRCRAFARAYGLPADLQPRCVQIVLALVGGPLTKSRICAEIGLAHNRAKARPTNCLNAGAGRSSYLSVLAKAGLVVRQRIPGTGGRRHGEQMLYALTPLALSLLSSAPNPKESSRE